MRRRFSTTKTNWLHYIWKRKELLFLALAGFLIAIAGLLITSDIWRFWGDLPPTERSQAGIAMFQTIATITGGIAIFWNIVLARRQLLATLDQNITNRFEQAVGYLGDTQIPVRIGAIYAFERIARDSTKDHWMIVEVLTTFIVDQCAHRELDENFKDTFPKDAQAAIAVLGRRAQDKDPAGAVVRLNKTNLSGAIFSNLNFKDAHLIWSDLTDASFFMANLENANFYASKLIGTVFYKAVLRNSELVECDLSGADLRECDLSGARIHQANFTGSKGLNVQQIMTTQGWQEAIFDESIKAQLQT